MVGTDILRFAYMTATYHPSNLPNHLPGKSEVSDQVFLLLVGLVGLLGCLRRSIGYKL